MCHTGQIWACKTSKPAHTMTYFLRLCTCCVHGGYLPRYSYDPSFICSFHCLLCAPRSSNNVGYVTHIMLCWSLCSECVICSIRCWVYVWEGPAATKGLILTGKTRTYKSSHYKRNRRQGQTGHSGLVDWLARQGRIGTTRTLHAPITPHLLTGSSRITVGWSLCPKEDTVQGFAPLRGSGWY